LGYQVHIPPTERAYLDNLPLSDVARERVEDFITYAIADVDDATRNDPANRPQPGPPYFQRQLLLLDIWGDGRVHTIDVVVNDAAAAYGVLVFVYVDHR
jgi:hypothetical protein